MLRVADLFCGVGSFSMAAEAVGMRYVFACDNDPNVRKIYRAQFGMDPSGDIRKIDPIKVPDHDILCASFPRQPFSKATGEERGALITPIINILRIKRPMAFVLEDMKGILDPERSDDFTKMQGAIQGVGYDFRYQQIKCEEYGVPQTRHRIFIIGFRDVATGNVFRYPATFPSCPTLTEFLDLRDTPLEKALSNTLGSSIKKADPSQPSWRSYKIKDSDKSFEYQIQHVMKLQGIPPDYNWGDVHDDVKWKVIGNATPTNISKAILASVKDALIKVPPRLEPQKIVAVPVVELEDDDEDLRPPPAKKPVLPTTICIKSGTSICLALPDGTTEQSYVLRIIK